MPSSEVVFEKAGAVVRVLVSSRDTRGEYTVCEVETSRPLSVPEHIHAYEDQWFHVLSGECRIEVGGQQFTSGPGAAVAIPRHCACRLSSEGPARLLVVARPGGLDLFFHDAGGAAELAPVFEKHGISVNA